MYVWKVLEGPFGPDDLGVPDKAMVTVMVTDYKDDKEWDDLNLWFDDFDSCYKFSTQLQDSLEPIKLVTESYDG
jgi:hypothetical protein